MLQNQLPLPLKASSKTTIKSPSFSTQSAGTMGKKVDAVPKPKQSKSRNGKLPGDALCSSSSSSSSSSHPALAAAAAPAVVVVLR